MALLRVVHAAAMPDPGELARLLRGGASAAVAGAPVSQPSEEAPSAALPERLEDVIELLHGANKSRLAGHLHDCGAIVTFAPPQMALRLTASWASGDFYAELAKALGDITSVRWQISHSDGPAAATLMQQEMDRIAADNDAIMDMPVVKAAIAAFPGSELVRNDQPEQWSVGT